MYWFYIKPVFTYALSNLTFARNGQPFFSGPAGANTFLPGGAYARNGHPFIVYRKN